jgi:hypothetical protein
VLLLCVLGCQLLLLHACFSLTTPDAPKLQGRHALGPGKGLDRLARVLQVDACEAAQCGAARGRRRHAAAHKI